MPNAAASAPHEKNRTAGDNGTEDRGKLVHVESCRSDPDANLDRPPADSVSSAELPFLQGLEPLPAVREVAMAGGRAAWLTVKCPYKPAANEDAVAVIPAGDQQGLLVVADGLGGHRGGRRASQLMKTNLQRAVQKKQPVAPLALMISGIVPIPCRVETEARPDPRTTILNEIERVNQRLLRSRIGAATTLALVEIQGRRVRSYHVGDSEILIVSQRGRLKFSSISHSPIGYAVESGMLTEEEALFHPDRHLVSNVIGSDQMSVELGPWITLSPRDTVLLASDGLFDNLMQGEIIEYIRKGKLSDCVQQLAELARNRMLFPGLDSPSKPDDLTILVYRGGTTSPRRAESA